MRLRNLRINLRSMEITVEEFSDDGEVSEVPQALPPLIDPPADRTPHPLPASRPIPVEALKVEPYGPDAGHEQDHNFELVSRHDIAETGLTCPRCHQLVCGRADFTKVRIFVSPSGKKNEGIRCDCVVDQNGVERPCGAILLASPDTEHGDNLLLDTGKVPESEMHLFRRKDEAEALREKYGVDIQRTGPNEFRVTGEKPPEPLHQPEPIPFPQAPQEGQP